MTYMGDPPATKHLKQKTQSPVLQVAGPPAKGAWQFGIALGNNGTWTYHVSPPDSDEWIATYPNMSLNEALESLRGAHKAGYIGDE